VKNRPSSFSQETEKSGTAPDQFLDTASHASSSRGIAIFRDRTHFIQRITAAGNVTAYDIDLTAESSDGQQHIEFSGAIEGGYDGPALKVVADRLQELVGAGTLRMNVGSLGFPTGQGLLDWLKANKQAFDMTKVKQENIVPASADRA
jgi:hypothetical protein